MNIPNAFVLVPSRDEFEPVRVVIRNVLDDLSLQAASPESDSAGAKWANEVADLIQRADVIVADVSDQNANIMYELGYAHALRKPTILLRSTNASDNLPFNLSGLHILPYDPERLDDLFKSLHRTVSYTTKRLLEMS